MSAVKLSYYCICMMIIYFKVVCGDTLTIMQIKERITVCG